ncbi:hypothetical protein Tco_1460657 [Tanacetum coccineum]
MVNAKGIHVDPAKIEAIKKWELLGTPTEIRQIIGLIGYHQRFIENFSKITKQLTKLTKRTKEFVCEEEQEEAFQTLKNRLCDALILSVPKGSENFTNKVHHVYRPSQSPTYPQPEDAQHETEKMGQTVK